MPCYADAGSLLVLRCLRTLCLLVAALSGCATRAQREPTAVSPRGAVAPRPELASAPSTPLPVAEPKSLLLVARMRGPLLARLGLEPALSAVSGDWLAPAAWESNDEPPTLTTLRSPDHPVELALAVDSPESLLGRGVDVAVSIPLTSGAAALQVLRERESAGLVVLERRRHGIVELTPVRPGERSCWLMESLGPATARLVCGSSNQALEALAPYLARGLPTRQLGEGDLIVEAWPRKFGREHGQRLSAIGRYVMRGLLSGGGATERMVAVALGDLLGDGLDLLADVEHVRLEVAETDGALDLEATARLASRSSWTARSLASVARRSGGATTLFWKLPRDTELAWFFSGPGPARAEEARGALQQWLRALGPGYRRETLELVAQTFVPRAPFVYAQGDAHGADGVSTWDGGYGIWQRTVSTYGWHLLGYDEPAALYEPKLDAGMRAYNRGDLRRLAYAQLPRLCAGLDKIRKLARPKELPRGSALYELPLPGKFFDDCARRGGTLRGRRAPNESIVVVMVPDGERTWIGFGPKRPEMVRRMAELPRQRDERSLAAAPSLELLQQPGVQGGGFVTLAGVGGLLRFLSMSEPNQWRRDRLSALHHRGRSPIPFTLEVTEGPVLRAKLRSHVPAAALTDLQAGAGTFSY